MHFRKAISSSIVILVCFGCAQFSYGQAQDTLIKRHQVGLMGAYDFGIERFSKNYVHQYQSFGLGYDYLLSKKNNFIKTQLLSEVLYTENPNKFLEEKDLAINIGSRVLFGRGKFNPIAELKTTTYFNVSKKRSKYYKETYPCTECLQPQLGLNAGVGLSYLFLNRYRFSCKSFYQFFPGRYQLFRDTRSFTQLKIAYVF